MKLTLKSTSLSHLDDSALSPQASPHIRRLPCSLNTSFTVPYPPAPPKTTKAKVKITPDSAVARKRNAQQTFQASLAEQVALRSLEQQRAQAQEDQWAQLARRSWQRQEQQALNDSLLRHERLLQFQRDLRSQHQAQRKQGVLALQQAKAQELRDLQTLELQKKREAARREYLREQLRSTMRQQQLMRQEIMQSEELMRDQEAESALKLLKRQVSKLEVQEMKRARLTHFMQEAAPLADPPNSRFVLQKRQEQLRAQSLYQADLNAQVRERQHRFKSVYDLSRQSSILLANLT